MKGTCNRFASFPAEPTRIVRSRGRRGRGLEEAFQIHWSAGGCLHEACECFSQKSVNKIATESSDF